MFTIIKKRKDNEKPGNKRLVSVNIPSMENINSAGIFVSKLIYCHLEFL